VSCQDCEAEHENVRKGTAEAAFYRFKDANIAIIACERHRRELFDVLSGFSFAETPTTAGKCFDDG
jgi:hypothetical protein